MINYIFLSGCLFSSLLMRIRSRRPARIMFQSNASMNTVLIMFCLTITAGVVECSSQNSKPPLAAGQAHFTNKPQLMRGPYLQVATDTSMVIRWRTDVAVRSRVSYQTAAGDPIQAKDDLTLKTEHSITLTGLKPGTKYFYSIGTLKDTLQYGADNYFSTFPVPCAEGHYRIGVFGDCGYLSINQAKARDQFISYLNGEDINAWILLGDNAYNDGNDMEYQAKFFSPYQKQLLRNILFIQHPAITIITTQILQQRTLKKIILLLTIRTSLCL